MDTVDQSGAAIAQPDVTVGAGAEGALPQEADATAVDATKAELAPKAGTGKRATNKAFAALHRERRELAEDKRAIADWKALQALKETDVLAFMEKAGLDFDRVMNAVIDKNAPKPTETPEQRAERVTAEKIAAWELKQEEERTARLEAEDAELVSRNRAALRDEMYGKYAEEFPLIKAQDKADEVWSTVEELYEDEETRSDVMTEDGRLDLLKVARLVEEQLFEEQKRILLAAKQKFRAVLDDEPNGDFEGDAVARPAAHSSAPDALPQREQGTSHAWSHFVRENDAPVVSLNGNTRSGFAPGGKGRIPTREEILQRVLAMHS